MNNAKDIIKDSLDIVDYINKYVKLEKRGKNFFGLCPFHSEKTPSFSVNGELGIFKCFGCGESGDIFTFVEKYHHVDFLEALEILAEEAGIKLNKYNVNDKNYKEKKALYKLYEQVSSFYYQTLLSSKGAVARKYLLDRGISKQSWQDFLIGFAPPQYNYLTDNVQRTTNTELLLKSGLTKPGKLQDKFYNRIIFTLRDTRGRAVGFSGRVLEKSSKRPKYLNTPETPIFHKRQNLFGLFEGKADIIKKKKTILVEGQTDVISSHQIDIKNIVAPLGTSITKEQLEILRKYSETLIIAFDNDTAGKKALLRATNMAHILGFIVKISPIPFGKDADECINRDPISWKKTIRDAIPVVDFIAQRSITDTPEKRRTFVNLIIPMIQQIDDPVLKDTSIYNISQKLEVSLETIYELVKDVKSTNTEKLSQVINNAKQIDVSKEKYYLALLSQNPEFITDTYLLDPTILENTRLKIFYSIVTRKDKHATKLDLQQKKFLEEIQTYILPSDNLEILSRDTLRLKKYIEIKYTKLRILKLRNQTKPNNIRLLSKLIKKLATLQKST